MVNYRSRKSLPPYVSYRTFRNFVDGLQLGIPAVIDRSYWGERFSGSNGTQLVTALRFLGLIDGNGMPMTRLTQLVSAKGNQRSEVLEKISCSAYGFLMDKSLDPQIATYTQLEKIFYDVYNVTGDVARKCVKFFIELESDAGVPLSPLIVKKSKTIRATGIRKNLSTKERDRTNWNIPISQAQPQVPGQITWHEMVLAKFPTFDPTWPNDVKLKWFEAFDLLLKSKPIPDTDRS